MTDRMFDMTARYYLRRHLETRKPMTLYRAFDDDRPAEVLHREKGWRVSSALLEKKMKGEIDDNDLVTEKEAAEIASTWGHGLEA